MNPEQRKAASETLLHKRGIRINLQLPEIETDEEVTLRSEEELVRRMIALGVVAGAAASSANSSGDTQFRDYVTRHKIESWLSVQEHAFLFGNEREEIDIVRFAQKQHALYFLAWCAGLVEKIGMAAGTPPLDSILHFFSQPAESPMHLLPAMQVRAKSAVMDWADLLYRLHWAVRHAELINKPVPGQLSGDVVREWHQAVNWMTCYEEEDNWDHVGTDTQ